MVRFASFWRAPTARGDEPDKGCAKVARCAHGSSLSSRSGCSACALGSRTGSCRRANARSASRAAPQGHGKRPDVRGDWWRPIDAVSGRSPRTVKSSSVPQGSMSLRASSALQHSRRPERAMQGQCGLLAHDRTAIDSRAARSRPSRKGSEFPRRFKWRWLMNCCVYAGDAAGR